MAGRYFEMKDEPGWLVWVDFDLPFFDESKFFSIGKRKSLFNTGSKIQTLN